MSSTTIERWYQEVLGGFLKETSNIPCPKVLGIDEHFFSRKKGYATTLADLNKRCVYDIALGRSPRSLEHFLNQLKGKERVKVILMDLSDNYRCIARKYFPHAKVVADRFHVIRLIQHHFLSAWKQLDPIGRKNRGLLSLMRRHGHHLSYKQKMRLQEYLESHPIIESLYDYKEKLVKLRAINIKQPNSAEKDTYPSY